MTQLSFDTSIFKDYDIRGVYPSQINTDVIRKIAQAIVDFFHPQTVSIGRDMRVSGEELQKAFMEVFVANGVDVYDTGVIGTEISYFIGATQPYDLSIILSASHNPPEYNGVKIVRRGPIAVSKDTGLADIAKLAEQASPKVTTDLSAIKKIDVLPQWKEKVLSLISIKQLKPLKVVIDAGNGMAGKLMPVVCSDLPFHITPLYFELDGRFPNHIPNPLIEKNTAELRKKIIDEQADAGLAFDGDADRTFLIDDKGRLVSGTITTALIAEYMLKKYPGSLILYNAICGRIVPEHIEKLGGKSKRVRVGHSFIKQYMKETGAVFAGEHSGHYYYRDYFNAESGALTGLIVLELLSISGKKLSSYIDELDTYPQSGEINFTVDNAEQIIDAVKGNHANATTIDELDGVSFWYPDYWFNIRLSKTEPLLRLNIEANTTEILRNQINQLSGELAAHGANKKE